MDIAAPSTVAPIDESKFRDPLTTAKGEARASVSLKTLNTLWINTGTLCNLTCVNCYIESSPTNDRLVYITTDEVRAYLDEIAADGLDTEEIGYTGGEPFMNPDVIAMIDEAVSQGFKVLVLTNAMKPMLNKRDALKQIQDRFGDALSLRISIDHFTQEGHEHIRGQNTWPPMIEGLRWLGENGFDIAIAGRTCWDESEEQARTGYREFFASESIPVDADSPAKLVLFPEMDVDVDVPEITTSCWNILDVSPDAMMCASSRMIVKRKGADSPVVVPCTLLPYDPSFEMGSTLADAPDTVHLNHPHCAKFCVLGGASCSPD